MIFYFSATGNCRHVVDSILNEGETAVSMPEANDKGEFTYEISDGRVGIVTPTYNWTLPSVVSEFLENLTLVSDAKPYIFYVGTYGTTTGAAAKMADRIMRRRGYEIDAFFDIKMPDTWTPTFDLSDAGKVAEINRLADIEIEELKRQLKYEIKGRNMSFTTPLITGAIGKHIYDSKTRCTSNLTVDDNCIGCGMCARKCPAHAIEMKDKRPVWVKDKCIMCLGCLHRCPKFAIHCGKNTAKHGQYTHP